MRNIDTEQIAAEKQLLLDLTARVVSSYVGRHEVNREEIPTIIQTVYAGLAQVKGQPVARLGAPVPAVPIDESITPDHIVCLEDGKKLKMIKRHLRTVYNMSVEEYRQRWGLPSDYPAVAPNYAKKRSSLAKVIGLGVNGRPRKQAS